MASWDLVFRRRTWEEDLGDIIALTSLLSSHRVIAEEEDIRVWTKEKSGLFSVSSCYDDLHKGGDPDFPHKEVWVFHDSIPTLDNLTKRGVTNINRCEMCRRNLELVNHLLLHCPFARGIWESFLLEFGIRGAFRMNVKEMFVEGNKDCFSEVGNYLWRALPFAICWIIWNKRNQRIFEDKDKGMEKLILNIKALLLYWSSPSKILQELDLKT
ncbi:Reverse transcriptase zinc-binding domain [Macleaya cordata]|uniref:Reverse transcriptase zinc-binding domain n=1 Tax=Macleaya cordata TaxID=56857 RepID=A0A200R8T4_MACCD|nr:Reverse transcriptase zinc-binding domain [Macleaya cordata]